MAGCVAENCAESQPAQFASRDQLNFLPACLPPPAPALLSRLHPPPPPSWPPPSCLGGGGAGGETHLFRFIGPFDGFWPVIGKNKGGGGVEGGASRGRGDRRPRSSGPGEFLRPGDGIPAILDMNLAEPIPADHPPLPNMRK